jgi:hypothetical protein
LELSTAIPTGPTRPGGCCSSAPPATATDGTSSAAPSIRASHPPPQRSGTPARKLGRLLDVLGGPAYEVTYPNGDRVAYVPAVYEATIASGTPASADGELGEVGWFAPADLHGLQMSRFARALLEATGRI